MALLARQRNVSAVEYIKQLSEVELMLLQYVTKDYNVVNKGFCEIASVVS